MILHRARVPLGSPPQVRGKLCRKMAATTRAGITPAGAGKTVKIHDSERKPQDHPRRCGENDKLGGEAFDTLGSPPQVRGKPLQANFR